jgi:long-subunit acyl-CoA synthetase (AMP-forming)
MHACGVQERSAVAIMGFNSPEWVMACNGAIMYNCIATGIYITNEPDACLYQINHSKAEIVVVETNEHLHKVLTHADKMPQLKAVVVYGEKNLPSGFYDKRVFLWNDFIKLGSRKNENLILTRIAKQ